jgi:hypothetical protein
MLSFSSSPGQGFLGGNEEFAAKGKIRENFTCRIRQQKI